MGEEPEPHTAAGGGGGGGALLLAVAAGITLGFSAALTKATVTILAAGVRRMLASWEPYALALVGFSGLLLAQSAFQAGPLAASLPTITVVDPLASSIFGVTILGERVATDRLSLALEVAAAAVIGGGIIALTRTREAVERRG